MIFLTVGTGPDGFDRLVRGVDSIAPDIDEPVRAQIGRSEYIPENIEWFRFTSEEEIQELNRTATAIISHAGAGALLTARSYEKPVVIVPRRKKYNEHTDDHQMEIASALRDHQAVFAVTDVDELKQAVDQARSHSGGSWSQNNSLATYLSEYIEEIEQ